MSDAVELVFTVKHNEGPIAKDGTRSETGHTAGIVYPVLNSLKEYFQKGIELGHYVPVTSEIWGVLRKDGTFATQIELFDVQGTPKVPFQFTFMQRVSKMEVVSKEDLAAAGFKKLHA